MLHPSDVVRFDEQGLKVELIILIKVFDFYSVDVREEHWCERSMEERTQGKSRIVSSACCRKKNDSLLEFVEMITKSSMEEVHFFFNFFGIIEIQHLVTV